MKFKRKKEEECNALSDKHLSKLKESGISEDCCKKFNILSLSRKQVQEKLKNYKIQSGGFLVPYPTERGFSKEVFNIRLDIPYEREKGKPSKYMKPLGIPNHLYIPHKTRKILNDINCPLLFVEGEIKSICASIQGYFSISIPGVWGFSKDKKLMPDFKQIKLKHRIVYIAFDPDKETNAHVKKAEKKLSEKLKKKGAIVKIVNLPAPCKVDDYIVQYGRKAFQKLINNALPLQEYLKEKIVETKEELIEKLKKESTKTIIHPAQDFTNNTMHFSVDIDGEKYLLSSGGKCRHFSTLSKHAIELYTQNVNPDGFSKKGLRKFLQGKTDISMSKTYQSIFDYLKRYVVFADEAYRTLVSLWVIGSYMFKIFRYFPYIWVNAEKGSGKSFLMELLEPIVFNGEHITNFTEAIVFREISNKLMTMLIDEVESFGRKNREEKGSLMSLLNAGFSKNGKVKRMEKVNGEFQVKTFTAYSPKMLAGINEIDDVLGDRTIKIKMIRKKEGEVVENFRETPEVIKLQKAIKDMLYQCALIFAEVVALKYFQADFIDKMPHLKNREIDIWLPLFIFGEIIDGENGNDNVSSQLMLLSQKLSSDKKSNDRYQNPTYKLLFIVESFLKEKEPLFPLDGKLFYKTNDVLAYFQGTEDYSFLKTTHTLTLRLRKIGVIAVQKRFKKKEKVRMYVFDKEKIEDACERLKS